MKKFSRLLVILSIALLSSCTQYDNERASQLVKKFDAAGTLSQEEVDEAVEVYGKFLQKDAEQLENAVENSSSKAEADAKYTFPRENSEGLKLGEILIDLLKTDQLTESQIESFLKAKRDYKKSLDEVKKKYDSLPGEPSSSSKFQPASSSSTDASQFNYVPSESEKRTGVTKAVFQDETLENENQ